MLRPDIVIPIVTLAAALASMLGELMLSRAHEAVLRKRGAVDPADDVYQTLAWVYPIAFVLMAGEGMVGGSAPPTLIIAGALVFVAAKALKFWAIATLGTRWTYRVLVPPGAPLIKRGPYSWLRHPNYVAVFGEIAGFALIVRAPISGVLAIVSFAALVRKRIVVEERALGLRRLLR
jgi:methyltransferase